MTAGIQQLVDGTSIRGDQITAQRYTCPNYMAKEWPQLWQRVWHIAGLESQIPEAGDFVVHNFLQESVVALRQTDGTVKAFFNVCQHRGNRLCGTEEGSVGVLQCPYHGWTYQTDGALVKVPEPETFLQGDPVGKRNLAPVRCETWGGFIWYTLSADTPPLLDYLAPIPELLARRAMPDLVRLVWRTLAVNTNWKFSQDNFNEAYHVSIVHPQFKPIIDEDYKNTVFELFPSGHNRMIQRGQPSQQIPNAHQVQEPWAQILRAWELNPADFEGAPWIAREALITQRRKLASAKGYDYMNALEDDELVDYFHHTIFPNVTITGTPEGVHLYRTEPHPTNPNQCTFDYWFLAPLVRGATEVDTIVGRRPLVTAEHEFLHYDQEMSENCTSGLGEFLDQDLSVAVTQQQGLASLGFKQCYLSDQELRVQRFHEMLNNYMEAPL
jgi:phenylpropionate dioxygenase-like ring-hydroxylating dioxygenase large terminal subunit